MKTPSLLIRHVSDNIESLLESLTRWDFAHFEEHREKTNKRYVTLKIEVLERFETSKLLLKYSRGGTGAKLFNHNMIADIIEAAWTSAASEFGMLEKIDPRSFDSIQKQYHLEKGKSLFRQGKWNDALDLWEKILRTEPDNQYIHSRLSGIISGCHTNQDKGEGKNGHNSNPVMG
jgi:hypothetical protein